MVKMYKSFFGKGVGINYQSGVSQRDEYRIRQGQTPSYEINWATPLLRILTILK